MREEKCLKPELKQFLPASTWSVLQAEIQAGRGPLYPDDLFPYLLMKLRTSAPADLAAVVDVAEGLEYRIWEAAQTATSYELLIDKIKTKRYTRTRIQRILFHFLLGFNSTLAKTCQAAGPQYVRVLGFNEQGRTLLRKMQKLKQVPIITKTASMPKSSELALQQFALDVLATNVQALLYPAVQERKAALDYLQSPVYVSKE